MLIRIIAVVLAAGLVWGKLFPPCEAVELKYSNRANTLEWFEGARLGVFIHWDARSDCESARRHGERDVDVRPNSKRMQELAMWGEEGADPKPWQSWNPSRFDAAEWVDLIAESGARYFTFTTMHAWSLSNFDNPSTSYDILSTPFGRDAAAELAMAAREREMPVFWYFNMFPSKHIKGKGERERHFWSLAGKDLARTRDWEEFRKAGVHALLLDTEKYGRVAGMWCDGGGEFSKAGAKGFYDAIRKVQPWMIFSPRHGHPEMPKDYKVPEQKLAALNWETQQEMTMPIEGDLWFWTLGKKANTKDADYVTQVLVQTASRDANLMMNISPRGDGAIDPTQADVLRGVGKWLKVHGESIFDTRGGPYEPGRWGGSTRRGNKVYLHLTRLAQDGRYTLPKLPARITSYRMLGNSGASSGLKVEQEDMLELAVDPALAFDQSVVDRVVELTLDRDAWEMLPRDTIAVDESGLIPATASASAENSYSRPSGKAVTDAAENVAGSSGGHGFWSATEPWSGEKQDRAPWLMLDLGKERKIGEIALKEHRSRIQGFVIEYQAGEGPWVELFSGGRLNHLGLRLAEPVVARRVRVRIVRAAGGAPQIGDFRAYAP